MSGSTKFLLVIISLPMLILLHGYTMQTLWTWFIVPHFGLEKLPFVTALGLGLIAGYLAIGFQKTEDGDFAERFVYVWVKPLMVLLFGYIYVSIFN